MTFSSFALKIKNDMDPVRRDRYALMPFLISSQVALSENTRRILQHTFAEVVEVDDGYFGENDGL